MSGACGVVHGHACATCGDKADAGRVVSIERHDAVVEFAGGVRSRVAIDLVHGVMPGDRVLVHQGVAIAMVNGGLETTGAAR